MKILENTELLKKAYNKSISEVAKAYNLTLNELKILMFLNENTTNNVAKDIVDGLGATKSHISMSVCNLEENGYIIKIQDENDKKKFHLKVTESTKKIIEEAKEELNKLKTIMSEGITKEDCKLIENILKKVKENLEKYNNFGG